MTLKRRLGKLEEKLKTIERFKDCQLEIHVGVDDEPTTYYCVYPDGHREQITYFFGYSDGHREQIIDPDIIQQLEDIPSDKIFVEIID